MAYDLSHKPAERRCVTAVFETDADARKAQDDLLALGFAADDIEIKSAARHALALDQPKEDPGIFESLLRIFVFMPADDRMTFDEALRRGGVALAVTTGPQHYEQAIDTLDRDGAINLEERAMSWSDDGWTPGRTTAGATAPSSPEPSHDPLENPSANPDLRERIGTGTSDMTVGTDLTPSSAASPAIRDTSHGRGRVRSYVIDTTAMPAGFDPQI